MSFTVEPTTQPIDRYAAFGSPAFRGGPDLSRPCAAGIHAARSGEVHTRMSLTVSPRPPVRSQER